MSYEIKLNILLAEDNLPLLKELTDLLSNEGYKIWPVSSPRDAVKLAHNIPFSCLLTELHLPQMSGITLMNELKKADFRISAIVISNFYNTALDAVKQGAYDYIIKPIQAEEVKIKIYHAVERYFLLHELDKKKHYHELSSIDGLTGVYNRRYMDETLEQEVQRILYVSETISLLMIDIDNFKKYNDTLGHQAGDELLKSLGRFFIDTVRNTDMVFRYGGEEFAVLMPATDKAEAREIAEQLLSLIRKRLHITLSIGLSAAPADSKQKDILISCADKALYQAKTTGKDKVCVYGSK